VRSTRGNAAQTLTWRAQLEEGEIDTIRGRSYRACVRRRVFEPSFSRLESYADAKRARSEIRSEQLRAARDARHNDA
jgi:hypothetical protein